MNWFYEKFHCLRLSSFQWTTEIAHKSTFQPSIHIQALVVWSEGWKHIGLHGGSQLLRRQRFSSSWSFVPAWIANAGNTFPSLLPSQRHVFREHVAVWPLIQLQLFALFFWECQDIDATKKVAGCIHLALAVFGIISWTHIRQIWTSCFLAQLTRHTIRHTWTRGVDMDPASWHTPPNVAIACAFIVLSRAEDPKRVCIR